MPSWRVLYNKVEQLLTDTLHEVWAVVTSVPQCFKWGLTRHFQPYEEWDSNNQALQYSPVFHHVVAILTSHDSLHIISLFRRRMMTLKKATSRSTRGLLLPSISPRWTPPSLRSCSRCPRGAGLWWFLRQCRGIPLRKRQRRSQACGRAASSTPTLMFRGSYSLNSFNINKNFV